MDEKILIELQEIKKELQNIRSILEPKVVNVKLGNVIPKNETLERDVVILRDKCLSILSTTLIDESIVPKHTYIVIDCLRITRSLNRLIKNHIVDDEIGTLEKLINKLVTTIHADLTESEATLILSLLDSIRSMAV